MHPARPGAVFGIGIGIGIDDHPEKITMTVITTAAGVPVADNQNSITAGRLHSSPSRRVAMAVSPIHRVVTGHHADGRAIVAGAGPSARAKRAACCSSRSMDSTIGRLPLRCRVDEFERGEVVARREPLGECRQHGLQDGACCAGWRLPQPHQVGRRTQLPG